MQSEYLDRKVREAAEKHHPAYDEKAWQRMEKLLNQHLPVQKDDNRRRILFILFFFLLVGGGIFVFTSKPWNKNSDIAVGSTNKQKVINESRPAPNNNPANEDQASSSNEVKQHEPGSADLRSGVDVSTKKNISRQKDNGALTSRTKANMDRREQYSVGNRQTTNKVSSIKENEKSSQAGPTKEIGVTQNAGVSKKDAANRQDVTGNIETKATEPQTGQQTNTSETANTKAAPSDVAKAPIHKEKSNRRSGFAFSISAGPDVSKAGNSNLGKLTLAYGAGISYTRNRFTLRTGVYAGKKIYKAGPADYELGYQTTNIKFEGADANCYVMEIPVQLFYNFAATNKGSWFAGAGLSSYLMKSEKYNYQFKTNAGVSYYKKYQVKNENKHYFSVLDLSGGYTVRLNNTLSLSAEPYLKIPFSGIGVGKVQLNSGGVLFTLGINPFKK